MASKCRTPNKPAGMQGIKNEEVLVMAFTSVFIRSLFGVRNSLGLIPCGSGFLLMNFCKFMNKPAAE